MNGTEDRPQAPVVEGGPVGFFDGGNRRDWFPGGPGERGRLQAVYSQMSNYIIRLHEISSEP